MITIIAGTNNKDSKSKIFAQKYADIFASKTKEPIEVLCLEDVHHDCFHNMMYEEAEQTKSLTAVQDKYMIPAKKFFFVIPEYNGSFPGALKMFIDACSIRDITGTFRNKKAALAGVSAGRAGNLRGMTHFASILNYLGICTLPNQLPISTISVVLNDKDEINEETLKVMGDQADQFLAF